MPLYSKFSRVVTEDERTSPTKSRQSRGYVSSQNALSPHSQGLWYPELGSVLNQNEGVPPKKIRGTSIVWLREKSKPSYFLNHIFSTSRCKSKACDSQK